MKRPYVDFVVAAAVAASTLAGGAAAQEQGAPRLRIGLVVPSKTGEIPVQASVNDFVGEGALLGARLAEVALVEDAGRRGVNLEILLANAPRPEAAERAARRLVELEQVDALIGGIGEGQAALLRDIAEDAGVVFLNIGSSADSLRREGCGRFTFHVAASASMYLDAMAALATAQGLTRWFVVHEDSADGRTLADDARAARARHLPMGEIVGTAVVAPGQASYLAEIGAAVDSGAEVVFLLLGAVDQIVFLGQQESAAPDLPTLAFPDLLSQTRDYLSSARYFAPTTNPRHRIALWETSVTTGAAGAFNDAFTSRFGAPADPTAWAAYYGISILLDAAEAAGTGSPSALVAALESPGREFDVAKGPGISFRPWDHQLRQPLHHIEVDQEVEWSRLSLPARIGLASLAAVVPEIAEDSSDAAGVLDRFGDDAARSSCRF